MPLAPLTLPDQTMQPAMPSMAAPPVPDMQDIPGFDPSDPDQLSLVPFEPDPQMEREVGSFEDNLAEKMSDTELSIVSDQLLEGIQNDLNSRADWEGTYNKGIDLLGLKMEEASSDVTSSGQISKVYHPILLEAIIRYQSNAMAEFLPTAGPVKVRNDNPQETGEQNELAEAFEKDFNHYLTVVAKEYYPDFDRMLWYQAFGGATFRKIYHCPLRRRPVDEFIPAPDLIVSNDATDLSNAARITHRIMMRNATVKRMQIANFYRDVPLVSPQETFDSIELKIKEVEGISPYSNYTPDHRHTIYECYAELDLPGFEHKENGKVTGVPMPYRVTLDKDTRVILEIRRNWREGDEDFKARERFVKFPFIPGFGFYDYGFIHILGNTARSCTAIERQLLDAGQFANFPGFLYAKQAGRQDTNEMRIPPGGGKGIDTGGLPIGQVVMPMPYKDASATLAALGQTIAQDGQRLASTAEINVGEGRADVPVGTTIAMIEQATKIMSAIHKRTHYAQQHEFEILRELFCEDPEALWRFAKNPARKWQMAEELKDQELVPASDPNTPSHIHRIMQATGLVQLAQGAPQLYNLRAVHERALKVLGIGDEDVLLLPPEAEQSNQAPPEVQATIVEGHMREAEQKREMEQDALRAQSKMAELQIQTQDNEEERQSKERIEGLKVTQSLIARAAQESQALAQDRKKSQDKKGEKKDEGR